MNSRKVLLVSMPFGSLGRPALGISTLRAVLERQGIACEVRYLAFALAELIGCEDYEWVVSGLPYPAFAGDWTFTHLLYGERPETDRRYLQRILRDTWCLSEADIGRVLRIRSLTVHFLDHCLATVPWRDYSVVGFTSTFEQNIASLALARRLKRMHPGATIVFGGANWEAEMGQELHRRFRFVDYVCSGEAESSFPALLERIFSGESPDGAGREIPGLLYRAGDRRGSGGPPELVRDLDQLPIPDFSDYFRDLEASTVGASVVPTLLFESARGCWWGAKCQCAFCGLNGASLAFRSKSAPRALAEIEHLVTRWKVDWMQAVDNVLDWRYFQTLLPALARRGPPARLFYEVRANLSRRQVELLRRAGVQRIQPGIESLSDHVLQLMRKGTTALGNIQLLKWCKELGVVADWNLIHGFPGERAEDYRQILELLPAIRFLGVPTAWGPVRLDRFSPYFREAGRFGFVNLRPLASYRYLYPFPEDSLARIAYSFDYDYEPSVSPRGHATEVVRYLEGWRGAPEAGLLSMWVRPDGALVLSDSRDAAASRVTVLSGLERAAYEYCDEVRSLPEVECYLRRRFPAVEFSDARLAGFFESLIANRWMVTDRVRYLSLAVRTPHSKAPPA